MSSPPGVPALICRGHHVNRSLRGCPKWRPAACNEGSRPCCRTRQAPSNTIKAQNGCIGRCPVRQPFADNHGDDTLFGGHEAADVSFDPPSESFSAAQMPRDRGVADWHSEPSRQPFGRDPPAPCPKSRTTAAMRTVRRASWTTSSGARPAKIRRSHRSFRQRSGSLAPRS